MILSIETSTTVCSAALHNQGQLIASTEIRIPQSTASKLSVMISDLMLWCEVKPSQIQSVAVSAGPGSYTGLRIGVATAKGICYALNIPLISINTLQLMAFQVITSLPSERKTGGDIFCPMLDARRMEVYCQLCTAELNIVEPTNAKVIDQNSFSDFLEKGSVLFFGNGVDKCKDVIQSTNARFITGITPSASSIGQIAFNKFQASEFESLTTFEPFYLKDFLIQKPKAS